MLQIPRQKYYDFYSYWSLMPQRLGRILLENFTAAARERGNYAKA
jgi:hypothetical protein